MRHPFDGSRREDVTVSPSEWQTEVFEEHRSHLQAVAYRMLGSLSEADDAVQESWLKLNRSDAGAVENMGAWLTTVVARVCLDMLRARRSRREEYVGSWLPEPVVSLEAESNPEQEALLADSIGLALMVVLDTLAPGERLAFVLHDMFGMPFDEIAPIVDRTPSATRQLASRARRRVRGAAPAPDPDLDRQREVVGAFLAAARDGDFEALITVLDPEVVFRVDTAPGDRLPVRGAKAVARTILERGRPFAPLARPAIVNGAAGAVVMPGRRLIAVIGFTVADGRIAEIDVVANPERLRGALT
jgi:RNA polymerase sigma-70 factor, ECF subfamily